MSQSSGGLSRRGFLGVWGAGALAVFGRGTSHGAQSDALSGNAPGMRGRKGAQATRRTIIDNDGTNLFVRANLSDDDLRWTAAQCPESVTTYMVCPNWCSKFTYPCKVGEVVPPSLAPALNRALERGQDPYGDLLKHLHRAGKEVFVTYRMNDVHNANNPNDPTIAEFKKAHPELIVDPTAHERKSGNWMSYCLDYAQPAVRAYVLSSLRDIAERYDVDGFQLDWMRFPRHLSGTTRGQAWSKRGALTEFVGSVRKMLDEVGAKRRRRILLAVRVPTSPEGCRYLGIDMGDWAKRKHVDFVTVAPFLSCDYVIPFAAFRKLLGEHAVPVYAGTDLNHSGRCHTRESYRGWALSMYDQGADGLNVFNFPCWTEYLGDQPYDWIADLDDPAKLVGRPALYTLVTGIHRVGGVDQSTPLPLTIKPTASAERALHLPRAALPAARAMLLVASNVEVRVSVNGVRLSRCRSAPSGNIFLPFLNADLIKREPPATHCRVYPFAPGALKAGANVCRFEDASTSDATVQRVDLGLWY